MSVKYAMLALLSAEPSSTYQLRKRFDSTTGQGWPINIGQVSSTLQRLERDGMVLRDDTESDSDSGGQPWHLTDEGLSELHGWWDRPVVSEQKGRDELVVKLVLATVTPGVDVGALVQKQRAATQRTLHDLTRLRREADDDLTGRLVLDHHLFLAEAELRWLDDVEGSVQRAAAQTTSSATARRGAPVDTTAPAEQGKVER